LTNLFDDTPKTMLHIAPETFFETRFRNHLGQSYITADLLDPNAMVKMDVTDIQFPDMLFDVVFCSHVLEHIHDDRKAIKEFFRVLKSGGWAIILVPIMSDRTFEDPTVTDSAERFRLFGQKDHVRVYGPDFYYRLQDAGFDVKVIFVDELFSKPDQTRLGLSAASGAIYHCTRN
jgi:SAM-dependent methyltransferase